MIPALSPAGTAFGLSFNLPLTDSGAGAVNTAPAYAAGSATATFTRATTAYTTLSSGLLAQVSSGVARSCYSAAGVYLGYLAEGQRTNICLYSNDLTNAAWTASNMTTAKTATGPDGVSNSATTITATAGNATVLQAITSGSAARVTGCYIKRRTGTGTVNLTQDNGSTWTAVTVTAGWTLVVVPSATLTNPTVGIRVVTSGDAVDVWGFQHEVATFVSSAIPTTSASVTRNADLLTYAVSGNMSNTVGSVYFECMNNSPTGSGVTVGANGVNRYLIGANGLRLEYFDGTNNPTFQNPAVIPGTVQKIAQTWSGSASKGFLSGAATTTPSVAFSGDMGFTDICIGSKQGGNAQLYGTVKNVRIYPTAISDAAIKAMTA